MISTLVSLQSEPPDASCHIGWQVADSQIANLLREKLPFGIEVIGVQLQKAP